MARVTSKLQVTIPKAVADQYGIRPGDDLSFLPAGDGIRVLPERRPAPSTTERLRIFDLATERQEERERQGPRKVAGRAEGRGWAREDLYDRGRAR
jgi:AbrB family looped-hinge helix DNA binding protein